jgi:hypothetical protein
MACFSKAGGFKRSPIASTTCAKHEAGQVKQVQQHPQYCTKGSRAIEKRVERSSHLSALGGGYRQASHLGQ